MTTPSPTQPPPDPAPGPTPGHGRALAHPRYRADIDGLRAVAVLAVLAFHAFPGAVPGGFVGVDVFFAISGYLITTIILGNLAQGHFGFARFYARRVRRIFPALAVVLAACLAGGWWLLHADDYARLGRHAAGGAGFVSNLVLWGESGYFDQAARLKPLLHLWSLGIEEQFYLLWPLVLVLAWRARLRAGALVAAVALASLLGGLWLTRSDPVAAFYAPWSRGWELMAGALLAVVHLRHRLRGEGALPTEDRVAAPLAHALSLGGLALVGMACVAFDAGDPFPGWRALPPVLGAVMLIAAGQSGVANRWLLAAAPMRWIGRISYPLYLWHWPLIAWLNLRYPDGTGPGLRLAALAASVVLAAATTRWVEDPLRFGGRGRAKTLGLLAAMAAIGAAGWLVAAQRGFVHRFPPAVATYVNYSYDYRADSRIGTCWINGQLPPDGFDPSCVDREPAGAPLVVLWGDSHAGRLYPGLAKAAQGRIRIAEFVRNACSPYFVGPSPACLRSNRYVLERTASLHPRAVLLFAVWNHGDPPPAQVARRIDRTVAALHARGVPRVVVIGPAPQWRPALPRQLVALYDVHPYDRAPRRIAGGQVPTARVLDAYLARHFAGREGVRYASPIQALCNEDGCLAWLQSPDVLTTWDYGHFTTPAAAYVSRRLALTDLALGRDE